MFYHRLLSYGLIIFLSIQTLHAVEKEKKTDLLIVFDCSKHMSDKFESDTRLEIARLAIEQTLEKATETASWGLNVGLRVFGDQSVAEKRDCEDTRLATAIEWLDPITLKVVLDGLKSRGLCTVGRAIVNSEQDFQRMPSITHRNAALIVLSHRDDCNSDLSAAIKTLKQNKLSPDGIAVLGINMDAKAAADLKVILDSLNIPFIHAQSKEEVTEGFHRLFNQLAAIAAPPA